MPITRSQELALAITPKFTASLSIPCSLFLIYEVYCDHRQNKKASPVKRALVGMSCIDILSSTGWFLSTWDVPRGDNNNSSSSSFALAAGNRATCTFQGFLLQLAIGAPLYNSSLAVFYLLMIKYRWTNEQLAVLEKWIHGFILSFSIGTSILLLPLEQYNHIGAVCWVIGEPHECDGSSFQPNPDVPCDRGYGAWLYGVCLFYGPLWVCVLACCTCMVFIYVEVRRTVTRLHRYSINGRVAHAMGRSEGEANKVAMQAFLYTLSFVITWMPSTLWSIAHWFNWSHFGLDYASAFCEPLQGFWNFVIFCRHRRSTKAKLKTFVSYVTCGLISKGDLEGDNNNASSRRFMALNGGGRRKTSVDVSSKSRSGHSLPEVASEASKGNTGRRAIALGVTKNDMNDLEKLDDNMSNDSVDIDIAFGDNDYNGETAIDLESPPLSRISVDDSDKQHSRILEQVDGSMDKAHFTARRVSFQEDTSTSHSQFSNLVPAASDNPQENKNAISNNIAATSHASSNPFNSSETPRTTTRQTGNTSQAHFFL